MKTILTNILLYSMSLFMLTLAIPGVKVSGGVPTYVFGGAVLALMFLTLKPVLTIITLPLTIITLGAFSFVINVIILYLLTVFVKDISINEFVFSKVEYAGFVIPEIYLNQLVAFFVSSILLSVIFTFLSWLVKK